MFVKSNHRVNCIDKIIQQPAENQKTNKFLLTLNFSL